MPFATIQGEGSVTELADRLFSRLTPRQRETAAAALIRANPALERITRLPAGTVVEVPDIPALRPKATSRNENPDKQVLKLLNQSLNGYSEELAARHAEDAAEIKAQTAAIKSARFTRAIAKSEELKALAQEARADLENRTKTAAQRQKRLQTAIATASAEIEERLKRTS